MTVKRGSATILALLIAATALSACHRHFHHRRHYMSSVEQIPSGGAPAVIQGRIDAATAAAGRTKS